MTRVTLVFVPERINVWLRFGHPVREMVVDRQRRHAHFIPNAIFGRIRWQGNAYGTTVWQLTVLQAGRPGDGLQRVAGVWPGARVLLRSEGSTKTRRILALIDAIEAQGIDPADVGPIFWQVTHHRLLAGLPLPSFSSERHAAQRWRQRLG